MPPCQEPPELPLTTHALIHTWSWWHLRAFDGRRKAFRNFALQRIEQPKVLTDPSHQRGRSESVVPAIKSRVAASLAWHETVASLTGNH
ncbi:WYL domain-containing protein [Burkholderia lata]|uniref:WYL domain-containing protein n=1 Tax=Burkholderia lata (strain ATCC 17760 / DSM 23089 / LMG 22485 / NCIMB 9086 / R18194 / 383) TaxID=482957 RepID=UPI00399A9FC8